MRVPSNSEGAFSPPDREEPFKGMPRPDMHPIPNVDFDVTDLSLPDRKVRSGYVAEYTLALDPPEKTFSPIVELVQPAFFRVMISDAPEATGPADEFVLLRTHTMKQMDRNREGDTLTVTYGNVEQAIVATLKDALLHQKKVAIGWTDEARDGAQTGRKIVRFVKLFR